jgi:hypothetical protein
MYEGPSYFERGNLDLFISLGPCNPPRASTNTTDGTATIYVEVTVTDSQSLTRVARNISLYKLDAIVDNCSGVGGPDAAST